MTVLRRRTWIVRCLLLSFVVVLAFFLIGQKVNNNYAAKSYTQDTNNDDRKQMSTLLVDKKKFLLVSDDSRTVFKSDWTNTEKTMELCTKLRYNSLGRLPKASVIITFHDTETISSLLQTIHSILQRTHEELIQEIIVIDDCSTKDDLGQILEIYLATVFPAKVKLYRNQVNIGLIRSRLRGSRLSEGEVIVFMDSHSEVQSRWLEPLLYEIKKNNRTLAHSYIDWMEKKNGVWHYRRGGANWIVYFDWRLTFGWQMISEADDKRRLRSDPLKIKTVVGSYIAIDRRFFEEIGELDDGMEFWGGENIDLSLRVWLFGGQVLSVPCSRVAHLEGKDTRSYRDSFSATIERNYKRVVEVWFDEYKRYFYLYYPSLIDVDAGNLTDRMNLKSRAKFNFHWFLRNVFPELGVPDRDGFAWGTLRSVERDLCLDANVVISLFDCHGVYNQIFYWSRKFELRQSIKIYDVHPEDNVENSYFLAESEYISHFNIESDSKWIHWQVGPLLETSTNRCLTVDSSLEGVTMSPCDYASGNSDQLWEFQYYTDQYWDMVAGNSNETDYSDLQTVLMNLKPS